MSVPDIKVIAALYIKGTRLVPDTVTAALGVTPTTSQACSEVRMTSAGSAFVTKTGLWALAVERDGARVSSVVADLLDLLGEQPVLVTLDNVDDAYFDVFVAASSDEDGEGTCDFEMPAIQTAALASYGLPVRFTVTMCRP